MIGVELAIRFIGQRIRGKNPAAAEFQRLVEVGVLPFDDAHRTGAFVVPDRVGLPAQMSVGDVYLGTEAWPAPRLSGWLARHRMSRNALRDGQRLVEVPQDVVDVLNAHRQPDVIIGDAATPPVLRG